MVTQLNKLTKNDCAYIMCISWYVVYTSVKLLKIIFSVFFTLL